MFCFPKANAEGRAPSWRPPRSARTLLCCGGGRGCWDGDVLRLWLEKDGRFSDSDARTRQAWSAARCTARTMGTEQQFMIYSSDSFCCWHGTRRLLLAMPHFSSPSGEESPTAASPDCYPCRWAETALVPVPVDGSSGSPRSVGAPCCNNIII